MAAAIVHTPQVLFLDEATSDVDPAKRGPFWEMIYSLLEGVVTVLVTTHYIIEAEYCGRVGIMRNGKLLALGVLEMNRDVVRPHLEGDHLSAITRPGIGARAINTAVRAGGGRLISFQEVEPKLEDVFLTLAAEQ